MNYIYAIATAVIIALLIMIYLKIKKIDEGNSQITFLNGFAVFFVVVVMACLCVAVILQRQADTGSTNGDLLSMQSITLTITATAVTLMTIVHALQNYDREKKDKELEKSLQEKFDAEKTKLQEEFDKKTSDFKTKENELNNAITEFNTMRDELKSSIFVLFDGNSDDDAYLNVRLVNNKALYEKEPENINVALAYIDALARCAKKEEADEQFAKNKLIQNIADDMLAKRPDMSPLQKISFEIKKANAYYANGRLRVDFVEQSKKEEAFGYFESAYQIFVRLLESNDTPKELNGYLQGQLGLCSFWKYKASGETKMEYLESSKNHYAQWKMNANTKTDIRMLNSSIVAEHNLARKNPDKEKKILQLEETLDDYKKLIKIDPGHQKTWLNVASVDADIVHTLLDIDIRETDYEIKDIDTKNAARIRKACDEGFEYLETAMIFNPGFFDLYYKYADLACCKSLIADQDERTKLMNEAVMRLDVAEKIKTGSTQVQSVRNLHKKCMDYFDRPKENK